MSKTTLHLTSRECKEEKNNDCEFEKKELLFFIKPRKFTDDEEKLIRIFDKLKLKCNLFDAKKIIFNFKHLTDLTLCYVSVEYLPDCIKNLFNLICLDLSHNKLTCLPKSLELLHRLTWLDLSYNEFNEIPNILHTSFKSLKVLNLSYNSIKEFNEPPRCINSILQLQMSNNALNEIPMWIFNTFCHLETLDLGLNPFKNKRQISINSFGPGIYSSLQILNFENCNLMCQKLQYLKYFKNLEVLHLGNKKDFKSKNFFGTLELEIFKKLQKLKYLYMENNDITMLPLDFGQLQCIQYLNLSENMLSWLPDSFCDLINLKIILLSHNQLIYLPENIDNLINLQQIHLNHNKLSSLPQNFCKLHNLIFIDLYDNEISKFDSINCKGLNMLKGIDLDLNFLHLDVLEWLELNIFKEKYHTLKASFRKVFNISNRHDLQKNKIIDLEEIIDSYSYKELDLSDFTDDEEEKEFSTYFEETEKEIVEENDIWEEISDEDNHKFFEPKYSVLYEDKFINCPTIKLKNYNKNYCPADYHPSSVFNFYNKNYFYYSEINEEQFDSE